MRNSHLILDIIRKNYVAINIVGLTIFFFDEETIKLIDRGGYLQSPAAKDRYWTVSCIRVGRVFCYKS